MKTASSLNERVKSPLVSGLAAACLFTFIFCACVALAFLFARLMTAATEGMPIVGVIAGFLALGILVAGILAGGIAGRVAYLRVKGFLIDRGFSPPSTVGIILGLSPLFVAFCSLLVMAFLPRTEQLVCRYNGAAVVRGRDFHVAYELAQGTDVVLEVIQASRGLTAPDSGWANRLYIQVSPELLTEGQELAIPSAGVRPFFIKSVGPWADVGSESVQGRLKILQVQVTALKVWLEVRVAYPASPYEPVEAFSNEWKYDSLVKFETCRRR
jgi:hypothetical protein